MPDYAENTIQHIDNNNEPQSLYDFLISVLQQEIGVHKELYASFLSEREFITKSSLDELHENNSKKETTILKAKMLNEARMKLVEKISQFLDIDDQEICISRLMPYGNDHQKKELRKCQSTLRSLLENISEVSEKNKMLLDSSIFYVRKSIDFISQILSPSSTYQNTGELRDNSVNGQILCRKG